MPKTPETKHLGLQRTDSSLTVARSPTNRERRASSSGGTNQEKEILGSLCGDKSEGSEEDKAERDPTVVTATSDPDIGSPITSCRAT